MYVKPNRKLWNGRVDEKDGLLGLRWHQKVEFLDYPYEAQSGVCLLGFECDEGVRLNQGRVGAKEGADELKKAFGSFAWHQDELRLYDCGKVVFEDSLDKSHDELALHVEKILNNNHFPIVLGGGHEVAYGSFMGLFNSLEDKNEIAIINFDAHFDLRVEEFATSGTPFNQIAFTCKEAGVDFNYMVLGISKLANTKALFKRADELGVEYILDSEMNYNNLKNLYKKLDEFLKEKRAVFISIDCDVFSSSQVPSVSAVASRGMDIAFGYEILNRLFTKYRKKIKLLDIAEFSPRYDINDIGKKYIARLVYDIVELLNK